MSVGVEGTGQSPVFHCDDRFLCAACRRAASPGLPAHLRSDQGEGTSLQKSMAHISSATAVSPLRPPPPQALAKATNDMQALVLEQQLQWRDLNPRQPSGRRERVLVQPSHRHDPADLRQCGAASARSDQRRRAGEHRGLLRASFGRASRPMSKAATVAAS